MHTTSVPVNESKFPRRVKPKKQASVRSHTSNGEAEEDDASEDGAESSNAAAAAAAAAAAEAADRESALVTRGNQPYNVLKISC